MIVLINDIRLAYFLEEKASGGERWRKKLPFEDGKRNKKDGRNVSQATICGYKVHCPVDSSSTTNSADSLKTTT